MPSVGLIVSGGHTMLVHLTGVGSYHLIGRTLDDAAGEAFDKVAKLLDLPYPGGPEIDRCAQQGNPKKFELPRSMLNSGDFNFSFSGLKTAVRYLLPKLQGDFHADLCASFQEAVVDVLVQKTIRAAKRFWSKPRDRQRRRQRKLPASLKNDRCDRCCWFGSEAGQSVSQHR